MHTFSQPGPENTEKTLRLALRAAADRKIQSIVVASNSGDTAHRLAALSSEVDGRAKLNWVVVTHACEFAAGVRSEISQADRQALCQHGFTVITAAHALSGAERSLSQTFGGVGMVEVVAHTLRLLGQGTKVGLEIGLMARDAGAIEPDQPIVAIGGSGRGADTAMVLTPATTARLLDSKIHEIICKPALL